MVCSKLTGTIQDKVISERTDSSSALRFTLTPRVERRWSLMSEVQLERGIIVDSSLKGPQIDSFETKEQDIFDSLMIAEK